jgi:hypothetical protein
MVCQCPEEAEHFNPLEKARQGRIGKDEPVLGQMHGESGKSGAPGPPQRQAQQGTRVEEPSRHPVEKRVVGNGVAETDRYSPESHGKPGQRRHPGSTVDQPAEHEHRNPANAGVSRDPQMEIQMALGKRR